MGLLVQLRPATAVPQRRKRAAACPRRCLDHRDSDEGGEHATHFCVISRYIAQTKSSVRAQLISVETALPSTLPVRADDWCAAIGMASLR